MRRVRGVVLAGAVALAASVLAAGPAAAAKGGNSDTAHACHRGGHENRFAADTGSPFKNAGDCTSHGAQGGESGSLIIDTGIYRCSVAPGPNCWGTLFGTGLQKKTLWIVQTFPGIDIFTTGFTDADGNITNEDGTSGVRLEVPCALQESDLQARATTAAGETFITTPVAPPDTADCKTS